MRTDRNQVFDRDGKLVSEEVVEVPPEPPTEQDGLRAAARLATVAAVRADEVDGPTIAALATIYPPLTPGLDVKTDEVYSWDGTLVVARQDHTTQQDWLDALPLSLYTIKRTVPAAGAEQWQAGITVAVGDELEHDGILYRAVQGHTTQAGWEPPSAPALWTAA